MQIFKDPPSIRIYLVHRAEYLRYGAIMSDKAIGMSRQITDRKLLNR